MRLVFGGIVLVFSVVLFTSLLLIVRLTGLRPRTGARLTRMWAATMLWGYGVRTVVHKPEGLDDGPGSLQLGNELLALLLVVPEVRRVLRLLDLAHPRGVGTKVKDSPSADPAG